jgi:pimeloyl-ACP methyl ester carboxylesterase
MESQERTQEDATFQLSGDGFIYAVTHIPRGSPLAGLVVCPPILVEFMTNYRHEVLLCRELAQRGLAAQRFHYRGAGHSGGDEAAVTLETMIEDGLAAADCLRARTGVTRIGFLGTRWGALAAAGLAARHPAAPLVLWDPALDGQQYMREVIRGRLLRELRDARFAGAGTDGWMEELRSTGRVDVLGYPLHRAFYEAGLTVRLDALAGDHRGPVLLVQFGRRSGPRPAYAALVERLRASGRRVDLRFIGEEPAWSWPGHRLRDVDSIVRLTAEWLQTIFGEAGRP